MHIIHKIPKIKATPTARLDAVTSDSSYYHKRWKRVQQWKLTYWSRYRPYVCALFGLAL